jgi:1,4-dihydroxy-2-naphthoyl-CoA hydrolase
VTEPLPEDLPASILTLLRKAGLGPGGLYVKLGLHLTEARPDRVAGTLPVAGNTQPYGLLHGGATVAFAETLASIGSALHAGPDRLAVGLEVSATHHRGVRHGLVRGVAVPLSLGSTVATYAVEVHDEAGRRVCTARVSCLIRDP